MYKGEKLRVEEIEDYFGDTKLVLYEDDEEEVVKVGRTQSSPHFNDVVYSAKQEEFLKLILKEIMKGKKYNLLFSGMPGTGKTYSTEMIACETNRPYVYLNGNIGKEKLVSVLSNLKDKCVVCIDEIHALRESIAEVIYPVIEYGELWVDGKKKLIDAIFIGTTTEPENLPKPLLDRFFRVEFDEPNEEVVSEILKKRGLDGECINLILNYSLNLRQIKKIERYMELYGGLNKESLYKVLKMLEVNIFSGLSNEQEKYIDYLKSVKKAGVRNISLMIRKSESYIKLDIEPDLIRKGIINITSRGRELNPEFEDYGYAELKKESEKEHSDKTIDEIEMAHKYLKDNPKIKEKFGKRYLELVV